MNNPLNLSVKNLKTFNGMEGQGFSAALYIGKVRAAELIDDANGGPMFISPLKPAQALFAQASEWAKTLPAKVTDIENSDGSMFVMSMDLESWVNSEIDRMATEKRFSRLRKTCLLFRLNTDGSNEYRTIKTLNQELATRQLNNKYGEGSWTFA